MGGQENSGSKIVIGDGGGGILDHLLDHCVIEIYLWVDGRME